jgi:multiple sugar transport system substrate-binding protein
MAGVQFDRRPKGFGSSRRVLLITGIAALATVLAACSGQSGGTGPNGEIHLTMWQQWGGGHEQHELDAMIKQYEKLHPKVKITETPVTNNAKILASITGGNPPDIIDLGTSASLGAWATSGAIQPLDPMISAAHVNLKAFIPEALNGLKVNGKIYALPFQSFDAALLYNKKLFAQAGLKPPTTLEQLTADAVKLTKVGAGGTIEQLGFAPDYPGPDQGQTCPLETYGWLYGGNWFNSAGKPTPNDPANVKALTWERTFYQRFGAQNVSNFLHSAGAYLTGGDPFESGKLAMMFDGPWSEQYAKANNPKIAKDVGVVKLPAPASIPQNSGTTFLDSNPQLIPAGSKNAQAAFDFIAWLTTNPSATARFSNTVANIPQLRKVPPFPLQKDALFKLYADEANSPQAHTWTQSQISSTYATQLCQAQSSVLLQGKSPQAALNALQTSLGQK